MKLPDFTTASVLTVGDIMLDRYWHGSASRISSEAPIPVVDVRFVEERLGGAANVALNVATLGAHASLVGVVGQDEAAVTLRSKLDSAGILYRLHEDANHPTTTKVRIVSRQQQLLRADFEQVVEADAKHLLTYISELVAGCDAVILSDYDKGALADPASVIAAATSAKKPTLVDPKFKAFSAYRGATVIKPNLGEFEKAVGQWSSEKEFIAKARSLVTNLGVEAVLVTRHSEGMTLVRRDDEMHMPARSREVYDVSGAGDTVIAVLAASLAAGATLNDAIAFANHAAGIVVGRSGTSSVSATELELEVGNATGVGPGILNREQLEGVVAEARLRGEKIVFTNGCFDILHAGHVEYLSEAKSLGGRLIVAVNDDASTTRLKGEGRPINSIDRRLRMLSGLVSVDWVVPFAEDTPESLLQSIRPDVLVKGGDYAIDQVVGADIVRGYGGEVKVLKLVPGLSTSAIVKKINEL